MFAFEAESAERTPVGADRWAVFSDSEASADKAVKAELSRHYGSSGSGPKLSWLLKATRAGRYDVWLRAYAADAGSDSVHIDLEGDAVTYHWRIRNRWVWTKVRSVSLSAGGEHRFSLWARERDLRLDKVLIQPTGGAVPSGYGPAVSGTTGGGSSSSSATGAWQQASDGLLVMEAEGASLSPVGTSQWTVLSDSATSKGKALHKVGGGWYASHGTGPSARFRFQARQGGTYDLWLRAYAADAGSDSVHLDLDGDVVTDHWPGSALGKWAWVKSRQLSLSAGGEHTLTLWARENNLKIDRVLIQPTGRPAPSGLGPAESTRKD